MTFLCHVGFLLCFIQRIGPTVGGHTRALRKGVAVTLRLTPQNGKQDSRGPRGMARCVWLLTFEQPCDLPPVYEWFGLQLPTCTVNRYADGRS